MVVPFRDSAIVPLERKRTRTDSKSQAGSPSVLLVGYAK